MARTANVFARVEPELKEQAESVLDQLGIPMSNAVGMFLRQIVLQKGIPFETKLPRTAPLTYGSLTKEQFDKEIEKGMSDVMRFCRSRTRLTAATSRNAGISRRCARTTS